MKRIDVLALGVIPEMVFDQHIDSDLSVWHGSIINDKARESAKTKVGRQSEKFVDTLPLFLLCSGLWENGSKSIDFWRIGCDSRISCRRSNSTYRAFLFL